MLKWNSLGHLKTLSIDVDRFDIQIDINKFASTQKFTSMALQPSLRSK